MTKPVSAHLISHTHWDREWYLPFEAFRFHLVRLMDRLLRIFDEKPDFRYFVCDGQTIILDDYLEIRPEMRPKIEGLIRDGRLAIGPWHALPDEFLVSGESLIRNLLMGRRVARPFGSISSAGYVPDPFGHVAQLPQILNGFDIDNFIFLRGMPTADAYRTEFIWKGPDGESAVLSVWMKNIYFNASLLGYPIGWGDTYKIRDQFDLKAAMDQLDGQVKDLGAWTTCNSILLMDGCDHTPPQDEIPEVLEEANRCFNQVEFRHSTLDQFIDDVRGRVGKLKTYRGELRSSRYIVILPGVLSGRIYLKQWNRHCERLLERWAEPLTVIARKLGAEDHGASLVHAWRLLLQNHPHDSICGCSTDEVHQEMMVRFKRVAQVTEEVMTYCFEHVHRAIRTAREGAAMALIGWNPLACKRRGPLRATLVMKNFDDASHSLVNENGQPVACQMGKTRSFTQTSYLAFNVPCRAREVTIDESMDGLGYHAWWFGEADRAGKIKPDDWSGRATASRIESDHYRIHINSNGTIDVQDKATNAWFRRLNLFEDTEDVGDEYDYSHAVAGKTFTSDSLKPEVKITERGPIYVSYSFKYKWRLPSEATADRKSRSKSLTTLAFQVTMRVYRRHKRIEFECTVDNNVRDHRLRIHFPGPTDVNHSVADGHFGIIERPVDVVTAPGSDGPEPTTHHMRHFVALQKGQSGLAILGHDLQEYEVLKGSRGKRALAITLLRCVQYLSKDDLQTRPNFAGPMIETPEAQCQGQHAFQYAVLPFSQGIEEVIAEAESFANPVRFIIEPIHDGPLPSAKTFVHVDRDDVILSALKPAEETQHAILRIYNPLGKRRGVKISMDKLFEHAGSCNLKETPAPNPIKRSGGTIKLSLGKFKIHSAIIK